MPAPSCQRRRAAVGEPPRSPARMWCAGACWARPCTRRERAAQRGARGSCPGAGVLVTALHPRLPSYCSLLELHSCFDSAHNSGPALSCDRLACLHACVAGSAHHALLHVPTVTHSLLLGAWEGMPAVLLGGGLSHDAGADSWHSCGRMLLPCCPPQLQLATRQAACKDLQASQRCCKVVCTHFAARWSRHAPGWRAWPWRWLACTSSPSSCAAPAATPTRAWRASCPSALA